MINGSRGVELSGVELSEVVWSRVGVHAPQMSGISVYAAHLAWALAEFGCRPVSCEGVPIFADRSSCSILEKWWRPIWEVYCARAKRSALEPFIFHGLANHNMPLWFSRKKDLNVKYVLTVHDIIPLLVRQKTDPGFGQFMCLIQAALRKAHVIICVSAWTKQTLAEKFPMIVDKLTVIPHGCVTNRVFEREPAEHVPSAFLQVLYVARWEVYKNFKVIEDLLHKKYPLNFTLVTDAIGAQRLAHVARLYKNLRIMTQVSRQDLEALFQHSDVYFQASVFEGYCLPAYEALSWGLPVVFYRGHALDELLDCPCVVALHRSCSLEECVDGLKIAAKYKYSVTAKFDLKQYLQSRPTWRDTALSVLQSYSNVLHGACHGEHRPIRNSKC